MARINPGGESTDSGTTTSSNSDSSDDQDRDRDGRDLQVRREPEDSIRERESSSESDPMTDMGDTTSSGGQPPASGQGGHERIAPDSGSSGPSSGGSDTGSTDRSSSNEGNSPNIADPSQAPGTPAGGGRQRIPTDPAESEEDTTSTAHDRRQNTGPNTDVADTSQPAGTPGGGGYGPVQAQPRTSNAESAGLAKQEQDLRASGAIATSGSGELARGVSATDFRVFQPAVEQMEKQVSERYPNLSKGEDYNVQITQKGEVSATLTDSGKESVAEMQRALEDSAAFATQGSGELARQTPDLLTVKAQAIAEAERRQSQIQNAFARGNYGDTREIREEAAARKVSDELGFQVTDQDLSISRTEEGERQIELSDQSRRAALLSSSAEFLKRDASISRTDSGEYSVELASNSETAAAVEDALTQKIRTGEAFGGETNVNAFGHTIKLEQDLNNIADWTNKNVAQPTGQFIDDANLFRPNAPAFVGGDNDQKLTGSSSSGEAAEDALVQTTESGINLFGEAPKELLELQETVSDPGAWGIAGTALKEGGQYLVRNPNAELVSTDDVQGAVETGARVNELAEENPEVATQVGAGLLAGGAASAGLYAAGPAAVSSLARVAPRTARTVEFAFDPVRVSGQATTTATSRIRQTVGDSNVTGRVRRSVSANTPDVSVVRDSDSGIIDVTPEAKQQIRDGVQLRFPSRDGVRSDISQRIEATRRRASVELANAELRRRATAEKVREMSVDDAIDAGQTTATRARQKGADTISTATEVLSGVPESPTVRLDIGEPTATPSSSISGEPDIQTVTEYEGARGASGAFSAQVFDDPYSGLVDVNVNRSLRPSSLPSLPSLPESPTVRLDIGEPTASPSTPLGDSGRIQTVTEYEGARRASGAFSAQVFDDPYSGLVDVNINSRPREAAQAFAKTSFETFQQAGRRRAEKNAELLSSVPARLTARLPDVRGRVADYSNPTVRFDIGEPDPTSSQTLSGDAVEQTRTEYVGDRRASGPFSVQTISDDETGFVDVNLNTRPADVAKRASSAADGLRDLTVRVEPGRPPRTPMTQTIDADDAELTSDEAAVFDAFEDISGSGDDSGGGTIDTSEISDRALGDARSVQSGPSQMLESKIGVAAPSPDRGPNAEIGRIRGAGGAPDFATPFEGTVETESTDVAWDQQTSPLEAVATEPTVETPQAELPATTAPVAGQPVGTGLFQGPTVETSPDNLTDTIIETEVGAGTQGARDGRARELPELDLTDGEPERPRGPVFAESRRQFEEELLDPLAVGGDTNSDSGTSSGGGFFGGVL